jgi:hypothetical protein
MSPVFRRGHGGDPFCEPEHTTVCDDGHDNDGNGMLYYIIVQCLNRLGLAGEDTSSRRHVGNLMICKNAIAVRSWLPVTTAFGEPTDRPLLVQAVIDF